MTAQEPCQTSHSCIDLNPCKAQELQFWMLPKLISDMEYTSDNGIIQMVMHVRGKDQGSVPLTRQHLGYLHLMH